MKFPHTVYIAGCEFPIRTDSKSTGGSITIEPNGIEIGTNGLDARGRWIYLLHEIAEALFKERGLRYQRRSEPDHGDYRFLMNHHEFDMAMQDLAVSLWPWIKSRFE